MTFLAFLTCGWSKSTHGDTKQTDYRFLQICRQRNLLGHIEKVTGILVGGLAHNGGTLRRNL